MQKIPAVPTNPISTNPWQRAEVTTMQVTILGGGIAGLSTAWELQKQADPVVSQYDFIVTPTVGTIYTIEQLQADPVVLNSNLGYYTNFMNLLDYAAVAVPAGFMENGLPFGVTLFSHAFEDNTLLYA